MSRPSSRILQLDALRGLAALAVVLFHYTTRYDQLFGHAQPLAFSLPGGGYGVDLFFLLSGFVILWTLDRTNRTADFVVGRFARLYPAYWAAVAITFGVVSLGGLPGQQVGGREALWNVTMLQQVLGARHVDGAYWSLQVELFFYAGALVLHRWGAFRTEPRWMTTLAGWLALALLAHLVVPAAAAQESAIRLLSKLQTLLSLRYIHLFGLGIVLYRTRQSGRWSPAAAALAAGCLLVQGLSESWAVAALIAAFAGVLDRAANGGLRWLAARPLVFLGTISYSLYLVHQNVGYVLIRAWEQSGLPPGAGVLLASGVSLLLAAGLTFGVERPAMRWIKQRRAGGWTTSRLAALAVGEMK